MKRYLLVEMAQTETPETNWYHANLTRPEADKMLLKDPERGLFLIRDSTTSFGDYVLSVVDTDDQVLHFQIRKHNIDGIFSIEDNVVLHGLDSLVDYYKDTEKQSMIFLRNFVPGDKPPSETVKHGRTNLLHRATKENNLVIVTELLKCGYRIESKDHSGQTATHIATQLAFNDVLQKLITNGANVECYDNAGLTPLHYACKSNNITTARLLLQLGNANVQARELKGNGWVPLHFCAANDALEIARLLMIFNAALRPRSDDKHTPLEIAKRYGSRECITFFETYRQKPPKTTRNEWFHGTMDRSEANDLMRAYISNSGLFLIRYSEKVENSIVLSLISKRTIYHFLINRTGKDDDEDGDDENYFSIDNGPLFDSLEHLVDHYRTFSDGLPSKLLFAMKPQPKPPLPLTTTTAAAATAI